MSEDEDRPKAAHDGSDASNDVTPIIERMAAGLAEAGLSVTFHHEGSAWLRGRLSEQAARLQSGQVERCAHMQYDDEQLFMTVLRRPDLVACAECVVLPDEDSSAPCDRCGSTEQTIGLGVGLTPSVVAMLALCPGCHRKEGGW